MLAHGGWEEKNTQILAVDGMEVGFHVFGRSTRDYPHGSSWGMKVPVTAVDTSVAGSGPVMKWVPRRDVSAYRGPYECT